MVKWAGRLAFARNKKRLFLLGIIIVVLVLAGIYLVQKRNNDRAAKLASSGGASAKQAEQSLDKTKGQLLDRKEYDLLQASQISLASHYLANKDADNAERVLKEVVKKVPQDKIRVDVYMQLWEVADTKGNNTESKQYAQKIVTALKAEKSPNQTEIDYWSKKL